MQKTLFRTLTKKFFIIANILVAVLYLLSCYIKWLDPKHHWYVGFLPMASFYLLALLVIFAIFWLFMHSLWWLLFVSSFVFTWNQVQNIIPFRLYTGFNVQKDSSAIRVMDWNVAQFEILEYQKHPEIKEKMMQLINQYQPDIACFQEMVCGDSANRTIYNLKGFVDTLHFPENFYAYDFREDFFPHTHFGIIIFSKYPIIHKKLVSFPPHDYNSIFQYADILKQGDTIRVFNIHLQSLKFSRANLNYIDSPSLESPVDLERSKNVISKMKKGFIKHQVQADRIRAEMDKSPYPYIVCGDFNDVPNSYAYEKIGDGLENAFQQKGHGLSRTFSGIAPTLRIDNIFTTGHFSILQYTRVSKKLSDHFPIIADLTLHTNHSNH